MLFIRRWEISNREPFFPHVYSVVILAFQPSEKSYSCKVVVERPHYIDMQAGIEFNMSFQNISSQRITLFSVISKEILCANAVIDTFITSKGFNFLFNHITVWIAFSIESNNERPLPHAKGWAAATCFYESVSNNFSCLTFVLNQTAAVRKVYS